MQMAVVDVARNLLEYKSASSSEFGKTNTPVIGLLTEWIKDENSKRLLKRIWWNNEIGFISCNIKKGSKVRNIYGSKKVSRKT